MHARAASTSSFTLSKLASESATTYCVFFMPVYSISSSGRLLVVEHEASAQSATADSSMSIVFLIAFNRILFRPLALLALLAAQVEQLA